MSVIIPNLNVPQRDDGHDNPPCQLFGRQSVTIHDVETSIVPQRDDGHDNPPCQLFGRQSFTIHALFLQQTSKLMESHQKWKFHLRGEAAEALLESGTASGEISHLHGLQGLVGPLLGLCAVTLGFGSWPMRDPINYEDAWWECMIQCATSWTWTTATCVLSTSYALMVGQCASGKVFWKACFQVIAIGAVTLCVWWSSLYAIWVHGFGWHYPAPWHGGSGFVVAYTAIALSSWQFFPSAWCAERGFSKKRLWFLLTWEIFLGILVLCIFLLFAFHAIPKGWQWLLALILPLVRDGGCWLLIFCACRATDAAEDVGISTCLTMQHLIVCNHASFLAVCVGNAATLTTVTILLLLDFLNNIYLLVVTVKFFDSNDAGERARAAGALQLMILNETLEMVVPLAYMACFFVVYYGPNGHVMGNVRSSRWQYEAVSDIPGFVITLVALAAIDAVSLLASGVILRYKCKISIWRVYLFLQKEYGSTMAFQQAWCLLNCFCSVAVACGIDATLTFDWLHSGVLQSPLASNSTLLAAKLP